MVYSYVYYHGPLTSWEGKLGAANAREVVAAFSSRWEFVAHARAKSAWKLLNMGRCGYFVEKDGIFLHGIAAPKPPLES